MKDSSKDADLAFWQRLNLVYAVQWSADYPAEKLAAERRKMGLPEAKDPSPEKRGESA